MVFYFCSITFNDAFIEKNRNHFSVCEARDHLIVPVNRMQNTLYTCVIMKREGRIQQKIVAYLKRRNLSDEWRIWFLEINLDQFVKFLRKSEHLGYIHSSNFILKRYGLMELTECKDYSEHIVAFPRQSELTLARTAPVFVESLRRKVEEYLFDGPGRSRQDIIVFNDVNRAVVSYDTDSLISVLRCCFYLGSNCYGLISLKQISSYRKGELENLLECSKGKTLVVCSMPDYYGSKAAKQKQRDYTCFLKSFVPYRNNVRLILWEDDLESILHAKDTVGNDLTFHAMSESDSANIRSSLKEFQDKLSKKAEALSLTCDQFSVEYVKQTKKSRAKVDMIIEEPEEHKEDIPTDCYNELMSIIGLNGAKRIANLVINYDLASRKLSNKGFTKGSISMHMAFLGSPGTAKTTVARLMASAFKEKGVLKTGKFVEVGRSELVGKYIGHTAIIVKNKFKEAKGGILFIDEAYSLCNDLDTFGGEAINTIVQEMENHRNDTLVIFAGYPDQMEDFINSNPGLRSRIQFKVKFPDYTTEELCQIADFIAEKLGLIINPEAKKKLEQIINKARQSKDFGNGRFVRNVIEQAKLEQATRLMTGTRKIQDLTEEEVKTIIPSDIVFEGDLAQEYRIGFACS